MSRPYPKLYIPSPYPSEYPRRVDFLTPLKMQLACGAGNLELFHVVAETSVAAGIRPPSELIKTEHGELIRHPQFRDKLIYKKNTTLDPINRKERTLVSQKEILKEIEGAYSLRYEGEFPDIIIKERGAIERIPRAVEGMHEFDGSEDLIYYQFSSANFTKKYRRTLGIRILSDPYYFTRDDLWTHGIIRPEGRWHPIFRKMRSMLRTYTMCTDATGWGGLGKDGIEAVERASVGRLWNLDLGMPARIIGELDDTSMDIQIYRLAKRNLYIALESFGS